MESGAGLGDVKLVAARLDAELRALPVRNTPNMRAVCHQLFRDLAPASPEAILALARELLQGYDDYRWIAYELIASHPETFQRLGQAELEELGRGINSWWTVDSFARTLSGPAWLKRQVPDALIHRWAGSEDRWWRRAALVSTVALNARCHGGFGDVPRTLAVCRRLADDHDDMVVKAMSWALRELLVFDPDAVRRFLSEHEVVLAARVKREVRNKLDTGLKSPRRKKKSNES
jgi:3-methyladenine DNA glycosylase AlkD